MKTVSLIWGILSILGMLVAIIPCLGALNWLNVPFAGLGLIVGAITYSRGAPDENKSSATAGMVLCAIAVLIGLGRLTMGGGIL
jgi:hypothetical protein